MRTLLCVFSSVMILLVSATPAYACLEPKLVNGQVELQNKCSSWIRAEVQNANSREIRTYTFQSNSSRHGGFFSTVPYRVMRELPYAEPTGRPNVRYVTLRDRNEGNSGYAWYVDNHSGFYVDLILSFPDATFRGRKGAKVHILAPPGRTERVFAYEKRIPGFITVAVADPF